MSRLRARLRLHPGLVPLAAVIYTFAFPGIATAAPKAEFTVEPAAPAPGQVVTFTSISQPADGTTITNHKWDLDGVGGFETDTDMSPKATKVYDGPITLGVRLQVQDSTGAKDAVRHFITIRNAGGQSPTASFTYAPATPAAGDPVLFTSTSADPEGELAAQAWDLDGNGNFDNGGGPTALRSFPAGSHAVGLRVTDAGGNTAFYSQTVVVGAAAGLKSSSALRLLSPFPVVRIAGRLLRRGTAIRLLRVDAPPGAKITIRCTGRGCPFSKQVRTARRGGPPAWAARQVRVRRLERLLRPGVILRVFVTRSNAIGKYTRFKIRSGKAPARLDRCLNPGSWQPVRCPP